MPLLPGTRQFQRYEILRHVGSDGVAQVYRALDLRLGRDVALVALEGTTTHDAASLLNRENLLQARASLQSPGLATVMDFGAEGTRLILVVDWMEGSSLHRRLQDGPPLEAEALRRAGRELLRALETIHARGLCLSRLQAQDVFLESEGHARLMAYHLERPSNEELAHCQHLDLQRLALLLAPLSPPRDPLGPALTRLAQTHSVSPGQVDAELARPHQSRPRCWLFTAIPAAALLAGVLFVAAHRSLQRSRPLSVVVAPFENLDPNPDTDYLGSGLASILSDSLQRSGGLRVLSIPGRQDPRHRPPGPVALARDYGADMTLTGRFRSRQGRLSLELTLVRSRDGVRVWHKQSDRPEDRLLDLARESSNQLIEAFHGVPWHGRSPSGLFDTQDPEAYRLCLQGHYQMGARTPESLRRARDSFSAAVRRDPGFARAHAGLADCLALMGVWSLLPPAEAERLAMAAARKALALDPGLGEAHAALAYTLFRFSHRWEDAEAAFRTALRLDPGASQTHHWMGFFLSTLGRHDEALQHLRRALDLEPLSLPARSNYAMALGWAGRSREAEEECRKVLEQDPAYRNALHRLQLLFEDEGRIAECLDAWERQSLLENHPPEACRKAREAFRRGGAKAFWQMRLAQLETGHALPTTCAAAAAALGDADKAFRWLERAMDVNDPFLVWVPTRPIYAPLRSDPRFARVVARLRLPRR